MSRRHINHEKRIEIAALHRAGTKQKYIAEGSTILTDEWRGYSPHPRFFNHYTVNHSKEFVHPHDRRIHTNTIEGLCLGTAETKTSSLLQWSITSQHSGLSERILLPQKL